MIEDWLRSNTNGSSGKQRAADLTATPLPATLDRRRVSGDGVIGEWKDGTPAYCERHLEGGGRRSPASLQTPQHKQKLTTTTEVENWPGDSEVQGPDLMVRMQDHAKAMGCEIIGDLITSVDFSKRPFVAQSDSGTEYVADAIILATGARAKWLGLSSEDKFKGFGVSACATCDGFFYRRVAGCRGYCC